MRLLVSADTWIILGHSLLCVVSTKEVQAVGLAALSPSYLLAGSHWDTGEA